MPPYIIAIIVCFVLFDIVLMAMFLPFVFLSKRTAEAGAPVPPMRFIMIKLRGGNPNSIAEALIQARKAGLEDLSVDDLETHALAGGNIARVVGALKTAKDNGMEMTIEQACEFDLSNREVGSEAPSNGEA